MINILSSYNIIFYLEVKVINNEKTYINSKNIFNRISSSLLLRIFTAIFLNNFTYFLIGLFNIADSNNTQTWIFQAIITIIITFISINRLKVLTTLKINQTLKIPKISIYTFIKILFISISILFLTGIFSKIIGNISNSSLTNSVVSSFNTIPSLFFSFFTICIIIPFCEELLFRGYVQNSLTNIDFISRIIITSLLFALIHTSLSQFILAFLLGIIFSITTEKYSSILPSIIIHTCINTLSFAENLLLYNKYTLIINLLYIFILTITILGIIYTLIYFNKYKHELSILKVDLKQFKLFLTSKYSIFYGIISIFLILSSMINT